VDAAGVERHVAQARPKAAARVATAQRKREAAEQWAEQARGGRAGGAGEWARTGDLRPAGQEARPGAGASGTGDDHRAHRR